MTLKNALDLPTPDAAAIAHSQRLQLILADAIKNAAGRIPFQQFMQQALYHPLFGYYRSGAKKLGKGGDFVTAPELSPLFSQLLARQIQQVLSRVSDPCILELGAGSGVMALEILRELDRQNSLPHYYYILEVSAELKSRQRTLITEQAPQYLDRLRWLEKLPEQPISGVIIANEVLDAMPVHKFRIENGLQEYFVSYRNDQFCWHLDLPSSPLVSAVKELEVELLEGYSSEINLLLEPWIKSLSDSLQQGLILLIDYGFVRREYYHPQRSMGTLMCHYQHRAHDDPLIFPGIQDITASVDFTAVAFAAEKSGLDVAGFTHQAAFLINCGLVEFENKALALDTVDQYHLAQQIKRLTLPSEMGERFKVIALTKAFDELLLGFSQFDQMERL